MQDILCCGKYTLSAFRLCLIVKSIANTFISGTSFALSTLCENQKADIMLFGRLLSDI